MRSEVTVSERRACGLIEMHRGPVAIDGGGTKIRVCGSGCVSWRRYGDGSVTGG